MTVQPQTAGMVATSRGLIEVASVGDGPAVIALHGGMGGFDQSLLLARALGIAGCRVLVVSRPGYLGTPMLPGRGQEDQADLYAALLDTLAIERTAVIAVSAGGPSALHFALRHADRCRGLIMVSTCTGQLAIPPEVQRRLPILKIAARVPPLLALLRWATRRNPENAARRAIADDAVRARTLSHPEAGPMLFKLQTSTFERLAERLPGTLSDMAQFEHLPALPFADVQVPILAIHGTGDRVVPFAHARALASLAPRCDLMAIEGGEHVSLVTHLDAVRERVRAFLDGLPA